MKDIEYMAHFLPKFVTIWKTPDFPFRDSIEFETVELKTRDVIDAFMSLQRRAMEKANSIRDTERRNDATRKISNMVYFRK